MPDQNAPSVSPDNSRVVAIVAVVGVLGVAAVVICGGISAGMFFMATEMQKQASKKQLESAREAREQRTFQQYWNARRDVDNAAIVQLLDEMIEQHPRSTGFHNEKAWLLATCADEDEHC